MRALADEKRTFVTLDGLRGIAAIAVLFRHVFPNFMPTSPFASGYLAVDLFFVLSGFVLAHAYERALLNGLTVGQFMFKRVLRLYPLYLAAGILALLLLTIRLWLKHQGFSEEAVYVANLFYIPVPLNISVEPHLYPLNDPAWSLGLELAVNFVFAMFVMPLQRLSTIGFIVAAGALLLVACTVFAGSADIGPTWPTVIGGIARVTFSFFAGVLIYRLRPMFGRRLPAWISYAAGLLLALGLAVDVNGFSRVVFDLGAVLVLFPVLVYFCSFSEPIGLAGTIMSFLGAISYSLYVWQMPIIEAFQFVMKAKHLNPSAPLSAAFFVAVFAVAIGATYIYDSPVRRLIANWLRGRQALPMRVG